MNDIEKARTILRELEGRKDNIQQAVRTFRVLERLTRRNLTN